MRSDSNDELADRALGRREKPMNFAGYARRLFCSLLILALPGSRSAASVEQQAGRDQPPREDVSFSYSRNPSSVVLFVHVVVSDTGASHSMTLFGDGRLEAESRPRSLKPDRLRVRRLSEEETQGLLLKAAESRLAEWDDNRIESLKLRRTGGAVFDVEGGTTVRVTLALESFRRANWEEKKLQKEIVVRSPHVLAERFPDVVEFQGINWLVGYIFAALDGLVGEAL